MSKLPIPINSLTRETFRWKCMDGRVMMLEEMTTSHIFNSMKMVFNHLASAQGGKPVWFNRVYRDYLRHGESSKNYLAGLTVFFIQEIERRQDLPEKYRSSYEAILTQIFGKALSSGPKSITSGLLLEGT